MREESGRLSFTAALHINDIRLFIGMVGFFTMASRALAVVIGFQIYTLTHSAFSLGLLGLIEAVPALSLYLFGGHIADHFNRHKILLLTGISSFLCALALSFLSWKSGQESRIGLYAVIFFAGIARGFADPATSAFEAQVVPKHLTVNAGSWISSTWIICSVIGPAAIGFIFESRGPVFSYLVIAFCFLLSWLCVGRISTQQQILPKEREPVLKSIVLGWKFVLKSQALLGAMALDLFAVLFGGAMALLPIYADDILGVGAKGLGILNAAPALGALLMSLWATKFPPMKNAGRNLLLVVGGFGISMLVFSVSKNFFVSLAALFFSGAFDGVSVVIRRSMLRLLSPDDMRGRVAAANMLFICASNELGAFESGMLAALIGTVPCVAVGALVTLCVVGVTALRSSQLRNLKFNLSNFDTQI